MLSKESRMGWHVLPADGRLARGPDPRPQVFVGVPLRAEDGWSVNICIHGMHASPTVRDTLRYCVSEPGVKLCRVVVTGELDSESTKFAGKERVVLSMVPLDPILESVLPKYIARDFALRLKDGMLRSTKELRKFIARPNAETLQQLGKMTRSYVVQDSVVGGETCWVLVARRLLSRTRQAKPPIVRSLEAAAMKAVRKAL